MKKIILPLISFCFICIVSAHASTNNKSWSSPVLSGMPPGSYSQTCSSCYVDSSNTLLCACADHFGIPRNTFLPNARYCRSVENINGQLTCSQWRRFLPPNRSHHTVDIQAGPIWNQPHAEQICPTICQNNQGTWTGQWRTTVPNQMAVCGCRLPNGYNADYGR